MEWFSGSRCYSWNEKIPSSDPILESAGLNLVLSPKLNFCYEAFIYHQVAIEMAEVMNIG